MERHDTLIEASVAIRMAAFNGLRLYPHEDGENVAIEKFDSPPDSEDYELVKDMLKKAKPAVSFWFDNQKAVIGAIRMKKDILQRLSDEALRLSSQINDLECAYDVVWKWKPAWIDWWKSERPVRGTHTRGERDQEGVT